MKIRSSVYTVLFISCTVTWNHFDILGVLSIFVCARLFLGNYSREGFSKKQQNLSSSSFSLFSPSSCAYKFSLVITRWKIFKEAFSSE